MSLLDVDTGGDWGMIGKMEFKENFTQIFSRKSLGNFSRIKPDISTREV